MGYWGWRQMFGFCVSVLVVGCTTAPDTAATIPPTLLPPVTLIARARITPTPPPQLSIPENAPDSSPTPLAYTIQRGDTLLGIALQFGIELDDLKAANDNLNPLTLPIGATLVIPHPQFNAQGQPILPTNTPAGLTVSAPRCYPTATGSILCMGLVTNATSTAIGRVNVDVRLFHRDSSLLGAGTAGVEQSIIPAGEAAPYSLSFRAEWSGYGGAVASLNSADLTDSRSMEMTVASQSYTLERGIYQVTADLHNPADESVQLRRAVLMLWDASKHLTGYRVMALTGTVDSGENLALHISAVPYVGGTVSHTLFIEAASDQ